MKIKTQKLISCVLLVLILMTSILPTSASDTLNLNQSVSLNLSCDKQGYEFTVYQVGTLTSTENPFETKYNSFEDELSSSVLSGDTEELLKALNNLTLENSPIIETFNSTNEQNKTLTNLEQGIYYIKATNYPAGVKAVQNSVVALPYFNGNNWVYELDTVNLATKVLDDTPTTKKEITNSSKNNSNFTDVSLGDTVEFEITSTTTGSREMKLKSYVISDDMSSGLTLNNESIKLYLLDIDKNEVVTLNESFYTVNITQQADGENTLFNVSLTEDFLNQDMFYSSQVYYTSLTYTADLNKYAVVGTMGNPNEELHLEYSNQNGVMSSVEGNTVYVYTFAITTSKSDEDKKPLEGAEFTLYKTKSDAESNTNALASGTSNADGLVTYFNLDGQEMKLQSGTYFIKETKAPTGYITLDEVIENKIDVTYGDIFLDNTYITNAPLDGVATVSITNEKEDDQIETDGGDDETDTDGDGDNIQTGDTRNIILLSSILFISFTVISITLILSKRKEGA